MASVFVADQPSPDAPTTNAPSAGVSPGAGVTGPSGPDPGQRTLDLLNSIKNAPVSKEAAPPTAPEGPGENDAGASTLKFLQGVKDGTLPPPKKPYQTTATSIAGQFGGGLSEGAIDALGMPVDAVTWAMNLVPRGINAATGSDLPTIRHPFLGSESIGHGFGLINPKMDPANFPAPQNGAEAMARGFGRGVTGVAVPEMELAAAAPALAKVAPATTEALQSAFGSAAGPVTMAKGAAVGGVGGATGEGAAAVAPDPLKPVARLAGNIVGGGVAAVGSEVPGMVRAGGTAAKDFVAPMTAEGQSQLAANIFARGVADRAGAQQSLSAYKGPEVPGSNLTTAQVTGDIGVGSMERAAETATPVPFNQRRAEQNEARVNVIKGLQPTGDPAAVSAHIRDQLADIDQMTAGISRQAQTKAQAAAAPIGTGTPEAEGAKMRQGLVESKQGAKAWEKALWQSVDPDGTLALPVGPVKTAGVSIERALPSTAKPIAGEERAILDTIKELPPVTRFNDLTALRSRVSAAMKEELRSAGETPTYARLAQLRGSIEQAISGAVEHKAAQESAAVSAGTLAPEETMAAKLQAQRDEFLASRNATAKSGEGLSGGSGGGSTSAPGLPRAAQQGGLSGDAGASAVPGQTLPAANFDQGAADRLKLATAATKERATTFGQGPVGETLATQGQQGNFRILDSSVGQKFWKPGPTGAQSVEAFRTAVGNDPGAMQALEGVAGLSLRKAAMNADGTLDPAKFASWSKAHADALRAVPDVAARFSTAAKAAEAVADSTAMRAAALDGYQKTALGKFLNVSDAGDVTKTVGAIFGQKDAIGAMRQIASEVQANPDAREGLRKAIADFMTSKAISNTEDVKADVFQTFVRQNRPVLAQVFSADELKGIEAVAKELSQVNRVAKQAALPARSNTAMDLLSQKPKEGGHNLSLFAEMALGATAGLEAAGFKGAVAGAAAAGGKGLITSLRGAGMSNVKDLVRGMLLHPELAKAALERASTATYRSPAEQAMASYSRFRQQLNRIATITATRMVTPQPQQERRAH